MNVEASSLERLIEIARSERTATLDAATAERVASYRAIFDQAVSSKQSSFICFVFHAPVPAGDAGIAYQDVRRDHSKFNYDKIVRHCISAAVGFEPKARLILVTDQNFLAGISLPALTIVRLPLDSSNTAYERVSARCAFVQSRQFDAPTIFLDSDAFLNAPLTHFFGKAFDIAVTYHYELKVMPINEGLILAKPRNKQAVQDFFTVHMATYDALCRSRELAAFYGNVKRWRGGQLALNALTCPIVRAQENLIEDVFGAKVGYFPANIYNFFIDLGRNPTVDELDSKMVLHLKGMRKMVFDQVAAYQAERWRRLKR